MKSKLKARELYYLGFSLRQIAKLFGVSHVTVKRWIEEAELEEKAPSKWDALPNDLRERILAVLKMTFMEKGRTRTVSMRSAYEEIFKDLVKPYGIGSYQTFRRVVLEGIKVTYGSLEKFEQSRRPAKERHLYAVPKGAVDRSPGILEIDATGRTIGDNLFTLLLSRDAYSGYYFEPEIFVAKTKEIKHYNKAFSSYHLARYLYKLFTVVGVPREIRVDKDRTIRNEIVEEGLKALGVKISYTYRPQQKLIERAIRDVKSILRTRLAEELSLKKDSADPEVALLEALFERSVLSEDSAHLLLKEAVERYNTQKHSFAHFNRPVVPATVLHESLRHYRKAEEEEIIQAFCETYKKTLTGNTVKIGKDTYVLATPLDLSRFGEAGRKKRVEVIVKRPILKPETITVYSENGELISAGHLFSSDAPVLDLVERREQEAKKRREKRRIKKLQKEAEAIGRTYSAEEPIEELESGTSPLDQIINQMEVEL
ncbi:MAG: hypothetical protein ABGX12_05995 [Desulfurobacteriaceae bacterium]